MRYERPIARTPIKPRFAPFIALSLSLTLCLGGSVCGAEEPKTSAAESPQDARASAQRWFTLGRDAYKEGDYEAAVTAFRRSYALMPAPALLFNVAKALHAAGHCDEAVSHYDRFMETGVQLPADFAGLYTDAKRCADATGTAKPDPQADSPAEPGGPAPSARSSSPDSQTASPLASDASVRPASGDGTSSHQAPPPAPVQQGSGWSRGVGLACLGVSLGSAVGSAVFALRAKDASDETEELSSQGGTWDSRAQDIEDEGERATNWAIGLGVLSGVTAATGVWLVLRDPESDSNAAAVQVATTPSGASMTLHGRF